MIEKCMGVIDSGRGLGSIIQSSSDQASVWAASDITNLFSNYLTQINQIRIKITFLMWTTTHMHLKCKTLLIHRIFNFIIKNYF